MKYFIAYTLLACTLSLTIASADPITDQATAAYQARATLGLIRGASVAVYSSTGAQKFSFGDVTSTHDKLEIGSVSKTFAAIAASELAVEKKLDLEAPISNYIPELQGTFVGIVSAHLLGIHTAQLPDGYNGEDEANETQFIQYLKSYVPTADFPAGVRQYSNTGFAVLGVVISRVSGMPYEDYIRTTILNPLQMFETGFIDSATNASFLVTPYNYLLQKTHIDTFGTVEQAPGGIYSNSNDMALFVQAMTNPASAPTLTSAIELSQTLGLGWDSRPGVKPLWKNGGMTGYGSLLEIDPAHTQGAFAVVNNSNTDGAMGLCDLTLGGATNMGGVDTFLAGATVVNASSLSGTYSETVNTTQIKVNVVVLIGGFLGIEVEVNGISQGVARLYSLTPATFIVDDGIHFSDKVTFSTDPTTQAQMMIYSEYGGKDSSGNPIYTNQTLFR